MIFNIELDQDYTKYIRCIQNYRNANACIEWGGHEVKFFSFFTSIFPIPDVSHRSSVICLNIIAFCILSVILSNIESDYELYLPYLLFVPINLLLINNSTRDFVIVFFSYLLGIAIVINKHLMVFVSILFLLILRSLNLIFILPISLYYLYRIKFLNYFSFKITNFSIFITSILALLLLLLLLIFGDLNMLTKLNFYHLAKNWEIGLINYSHNYPILILKSILGVPIDYTPSFNNSVIISLRMIAHIVFFSYLLRMVNSKPFLSLFLFSIYYLFSLTVNYFVLNIFYNFRLLVPCIVLILTITIFNISQSNDKNKNQ